MNPNARLLIPVLGSAFCAAWIAVGCTPSKSKQAPVQAGAFVNGLLSSESVGSRGAAHEKAVVGIRLLNSMGEPLSVCTGALIDKDVVLTAAHCFDPTVTVGVFDVRLLFTHDMKTIADPYQHPSSRGVRKVVPHPQYDSQAQHYGDKKVSYYDHDLALVFLDKPAPDSIKPLGFATLPSAAAPGTTLTVYGFGRAIDYGDSQHIPAAKRTHTLQRGTMILSSDTYGDRIMTKATSKSSICGGDSGGPGMRIVKGQKPLIATVTSATNGAEMIPGVRRCRGPGVLTPVPEYADWIQSVLAERPQ